MPTCNFIGFVTPIVGTVSGDKLPPKTSLIVDFPAFGKPTKTREMLRSRLALQYAYKFFESWNMVAYFKSKGLIVLCKDSGGYFPNTTFK